MFFQRKKKNLWKRLWRSRVISTATAPRQHHRQESYGQSDQYYQLANETSAESYYYPPSPQDKLNYHRNCGLVRDEGSSLLSSTTAVLRNCCADSNSSSNGDLQERDAHQLFRALMNQLKKESQLETLCAAIDGGLSSDVKSHPHQYQPTDCVLVPRQLIHDEEPQVIACRLWRWSDLNDANDIKRIPKCSNEKDPIYVCCNPAHWSRLCQPETPPPPYQYAMNIDEHSMEQDVYGGYNKQQIGSLTTDGEDLSNSGWCELAYWELNERVGSRVPVEEAAVDVFSEQPRGAGLCIRTLAKQRATKTPDAVLKTREKIGLGVTLSRESDGVWLYNRSSSPVFVHSPTLCEIDSRTTTVHKVPPGHCLRAFDPLKVNESITWPSPICGMQLGPVDTHSVRISFVKGWGPNYSRQDVTACPCWMEVLLSRNGLHSPCR